MKRWEKSLWAVVILGLGAVVGWAGERAFPAPEAQALEAKLQEALHDPAVLRELRIEAEGSVAKDTAGVVLYGTGIGIWNRKTQFRVERATVERAVRLLIDERFTHMPEGLEPEGDRPIQIVRSLTVAVGDTVWTVIQRRKARERRELTRLVRELAALCRDAAAHGVTPRDLPDALKRLASGELAPEVLRLNVNAPRVPGSEGKYPQGWRLEARHGLVVAWRQEPDRGWVRATARRLGTREARRIAGSLLETGFAELPGSLHWQGYCHVSLEILGFRHAVLARTFAGPLVERTRGAARRFRPLFRALREQYDGLLEDRAKAP